MSTVITILAGVAVVILSITVSYFSAILATMRWQRETVEKMLELYDHNQKQIKLLNCSIAIMEKQIMDLQEGD